MEQDKKLEIDLWNQQGEWIEFIFQEETIPDEKCNEEQLAIKYRPEGEYANNLKRQWYSVEIPKSNVKRIGLDRMRKEGLDKSIYTKKEILLTTKERLNICKNITYAKMCEYKRKLNKGEEKWLRELIKRKLFYHNQNERGYILQVSEIVEEFFERKLECKKHKKKY